MCLKMPSTDIQSVLDDLTSKLIVLADSFAVILGVIPAFTNRYTGRAIRGALQVQLYGSTTYSGGVSCGEFPHLFFETSFEYFEIEGFQNVHTENQAISSCMFSSV